jgi:hypothetical protein
MMMAVSIVTLGRNTKKGALVMRGIGILGALVGVVGLAVSFIAIAAYVIDLPELGQSVLSAWQWLSGKLASLIASIFSTEVHPFVGHEILFGVSLLGIVTSSVQLDAREGLVDTSASNRLFTLVLTVGLVGIVWFLYVSRNPDMIELMGSLKADEIEIRGLPGRTISLAVTGVATLVFALSTMLGHFSFLKAGRNLGLSMVAALGVILVGLGQQNYLGSS